MKDIRERQACREETLRAPFSAAIQSALFRGWHPVRIDQRSSVPLWKRAAKAHRRLARGAWFVQGAQNGLIGRTGEAKDGYLIWTGEGHGTRIGGDGECEYGHGEQMPQRCVACCTVDRHSRSRSQEA